MIGFTPKQATRIKQGLERDMARIEDAALSMKRRLTDTDLYVEGALDELREQYHKAVEIVDRRTQ